MSEETIPKSLYLRHIQRAKDTSSYFVFCRNHYKIMTRLQALFLQDLCNLLSIPGVISNELKGETWIKCTGEFLKNSQSGWTDDEQKYNFQQLQKKGFVHTKRIGVPSVRWVCIDYIAIEKALDEVTPVASKAVDKFTPKNGSGNGQCIQSCRNPLTGGVETPSLLVGKPPVNNKEQKNKEKRTKETAVAVSHSQPDSFLEEEKSVEENNTPTHKFIEEKLADPPLDKWKDWDGRLIYFYERIKKERIIQHPRRKGEWISVYRKLIGTQEEIVDRIDTALETLVEIVLPRFLSGDENVPKPSTPVAFGKMLSWIEDIAYRKKHPYKKKRDPNYDETGFTSNEYIRDDQIW